MVQPSLDDMVSDKVKENVQAVLQEQFTIVEEKLQKDAGDALRNEVVTVLQKEIPSVRTGLEEQITAVKEELRQEVAAVEKKLGREVADVKAEVAVIKAEICVQRKDTKELIKHTREDHRETVRLILRTALGIACLVVITIGGAAGFILEFSQIGGG